MTVCVCENRWRSMYWQRTVWFVIKSVRRNGRKEKGESGFMDVVKKDMKLVGVRRGCRAECLMEAGDSLWSPLKGKAQRRNFSKNLRRWFWKIAKNKQLGTFLFFTSILYFSQVVPAALEVAMEEDVEFRRGLPLDYLTYMGVQNSEKVISYFSAFLSAVLVPGFLSHLQN